MIEEAIINLIAKVLRGDQSQASQVAQISTVGIKKKVEEYYSCFSDTLKNACYAFVSENQQIINGYIATIKNILSDKAVDIHDVSHVLQIILGTFDACNKLKPSDLTSDNVLSLCACIFKTCVAIMVPDDEKLSTSLVAIIDIVQDLIRFEFGAEAKIKRSLCCC